MMSEKSKLKDINFCLIKSKFTQWKSDNHVGWLGFLWSVKFARVAKTCSNYFRTDFDLLVYM